MIHDMIDQAAYMAHGYCLLWKPWLIAAHAGSDVVIAASYFAIPFAIWLFVKRRQDLQLRPLAWMFAAFILLCGFTHLIQGATLWWPIYEIQALVKVATAIVSVATAIAIFPLIPKALAIPSPRQLQIVNEGLTAEIAAHHETLAELQRAKDDLEKRVAERTKELEHAKARFEALVTASAEIVWTANADGAVEEDSPSWRSITGQSFDEWTGSGWLDAIHPDDRSAALAVWRDAVLSKEMYSAEYRVRQQQSGNWRWMAVKGVPLVSTGGEVREWVGMNTDIDDRRRSEERMQFVMHELSHRTKNLLAVIQAMAQQSAKYSKTSDFLADFSGRIQGLSRSIDLLLRSDWRGALLYKLVREQLMPFVEAESPRLTLSGPHLMLTPEGTQALGLALHELGTNAVKHGALAPRGGDIDIAWDVRPGENGPTFFMEWSERCVGTPSKANGKGFGSTILTRVVPDSLSGSSTYRFGDNGVIWEIEAPFEQVVLSTGTEPLTKELSAGELGLHVHGQAKT